MSNWGFGNAPLNAPAVGGGGGEQAGPDIEQMDTPQLMFADEAVQPGDRVKLFQQPWPANSLPRPGASLLAIASRKKLLAAAGPDGLLLTGTAALRSQYIPRRRKKDESRGISEDEPALKLYNPEVKLQVPQLSHVAFSSDESCLVIVAEQGGGLACYDVNAVTNGGKEPAFQIATMGQTVRQLLPNPNPDAGYTGFVGIVLESGQLLLADLATKVLVKTASGSEVFHENVRCASWSKLGKQIVAGLGDSSCVQIDFKGQVKDRIPQPPQLLRYKETGNDGLYAPGLEFPTSSVYWLETHKFLNIYTPQADQPEDPMPNHCSVYFIAQREKGQPFTFRQLQDDPCMASMEPKRYPAAHYIQRLNEWSPALHDMLIMTSSATADIGVLASFKEQNGDFVLANLDETRKASLPMSYVDGAEDTTTVGMAMDFSAIECAARPVPDESDTIEDSPFPLPALCVLNTDGVLQMWWTVYAHSVKQTQQGGPFPYPAIVNKEPPHINYTHYQPDDLEDASASMSGGQTSSHAFASQQGDGSEKKSQREALLAAQSPFGEGVSKGKKSRIKDTQSLALTIAASTAIGDSASRPTTANGMSTFGGATNTPPSSANPFGGKSAFGGASQLGLNPSPWGGATAQKPAFGQSTFGQPPASPFGAQVIKPAASQFGTQSAQSGASQFGTQPAQPTTNLFGSTSGQSATSGMSTFGKPSAVGSSPAPATAFGQTSTIGGGSGFGQVGGMGQKKASIWGAPSDNAPKSGAESPFASSKTGIEPSGFAGFAKAPSPFVGTGNPVVSPFGGATNQASPFATAGNGDGKSAFTSTEQGSQLRGFGKPSTPTFGNENSMGSTATIGSTPFSSFGKIGSGSSALSREETSGSGESPFAGFKLGSGFKGDGSAKDDLPKPKNPGGSMFGGNFLGGTENEKPAVPAPSIKAEPGTEQEPSLKDIPEAVPEEAPLPPDPSTNPSKYKMPDDLPMPPGFGTTKSKPADDAPLPPDPSTNLSKYKFPDNIPMPPGFGTTKPNPPKPLDFASFNTKKEVVDDDVPIAGSPPVNVTNSQTFSSRAASEGPTDDGSGFETEDEEEVEGSEGEEEDSQDEGSEEISDEASSEPEEEEPAQPETSNALKNFMNRVTPPAKKAEKPAGLARDTSYTPAGLPKGPVFPPPQNRPTLSPRSPSPHRAVTSPVARPSSFQSLPPQIKTTSIPPAKPVERPAPAPEKPREPTAGELEDLAADRVKDTLSQPPVPSKRLPAFYTHQDYAGTVDKPGVGGQIETVYRDVNSMIDVLGLNARSLEEFLEGHVQLRKPGQRTHEDLEEDDTWCLGDVADVGSIVDEISSQLQEGQLENVSALLAGLDEQQRAILQLKTKSTEMRKILSTRTDPQKVAMQAAAPLSAELQAQQSELRQGVQAVQGLLTDVENKLALLRADLAAAKSQEVQKGPVPTVEAVTKTILKMTTMVEQRSGDVDLLESQIKRLPNGIASLRLGDDYEDDLVSALGGSKLLTGSPSRSTPPRRARMAANGDALGMSGMFGTSQSGGLRGSRFQTPPGSLRRSVAFTPEASAFGRSAGSAGGSARKKMVDVTVEEVEAFQARKGRRRAVIGELKKAVEKGKPKVTTVDR